MPRSIYSASSKSSSRSAGSSGRRAYHRILLKLSGEVLGGDNAPFSAEALEKFAKDVRALRAKKVQVACVIGGGNIWRFRDQKALGLDRSLSDQMGMMATVMNAAAVADVLKKHGISCRVFSSLPVPAVATTYTIREARAALDAGEVVLCAGGTGSPFFTTDSAAALRALELQCEVLLKATKVDYVCDKDPTIHKDAKKYLTCSYQEVIERGLQVMDLAAIALCQDNALPIRVFNYTKKDTLIRAVSGETVGTLIC